MSPEDISLMMMREAKGISDGNLLNTMGKGHSDANGPQHCLQERRVLAKEKIGQS